MPTYALSAVPATLYAFSLAATFLQALLARRFSRPVTYTIGAVFSASACVGLALLPGGESPLHYAVFFCVGFLGIGSATCMVTSVSMVGDLVGDRTSSAALVYGLLSFTDKLSNGVAIFLIQLHRQYLVSHVCGDKHIYCEALAVFTRQVIAFVCGGAVVAGALFSVLTALSRTGSRLPQP